MVSTPACLSRVRFLRAWYALLPYAISSISVQCPSIYFSLAFFVSVQYPSIYSYLAFFVTFVILLFSLYSSVPVFSFSFVKSLLISYISMICLWPNVGFSGGVCSVFHVLFLSLLYWTWLSSLQYHRPADSEPIFRIGSTSIKPGWTWIIGLLKFNLFAEFQERQVLIAAYIWPWRFSCPDSVDPCWNWFCTRIYSIWLWFIPSVACQVQRRDVLCSPRVFANPICLIDDSIKGGSRELVPVF